MTKNEWYVRNLNLDLYGCNSAKLENPEYLRHLVHETADNISMKPCIKPQVTRTRMGLSARMGLMTSHLVINTFPEGRAAYVVISSCRGYDLYDITEYLSREFSSTAHESLLTEYNIPEGPHNILHHISHHMQPLRQKRVNYVLEHEDKILLLGFFSHVSFLQAFDLGRMVEGLDPMTKREKLHSGLHKFEPQGETGMMGLQAWNHFYHTWPELNFMMWHAQHLPHRDCQTLALFELFKYTWHP